MSDALYTRGRFVWNDLMSTDAAGSQAFYSELANWKVLEMEMPGIGAYRMLQLEEQGFGGIVPLEAGHGIPSHWIQYISVEDVDATCAKASELGGEVCVPPTDLPEVGRFAVVADPQGAIFSPFRSADGEPPTTGPAANAFCWYELMTTDPASARAFYGELLGWTFAKSEMPGMEYWLGSPEGADAADHTCGLMKKPDEVEAPPHWLAYIDTKDIAASHERAKGLGGKEIVAVMAIPNVGQFSVVQDPAGAVVGLFQTGS